MLRYVSTNAFCHRVFKIFGLLKFLKTVQKKTYNITSFNSFTYIFVNYVFYKYFMILN